MAREAGGRRPARRRDGPAIVCTEEFKFERHVADGDLVRAGQAARVTTRTRDLLTAERTALNLLCHLSGVATATRAWVTPLEGTGATVRDTRKTTPGLRALEKYAVRCGGGVNHRMALSDAALVKDNHVIAAGGVGAAFDAVRAASRACPWRSRSMPCDELTRGAGRRRRPVLLDNFTDQLPAAAVARSAGPPGSHGRLTLHNAARSRRPAWTTSRSAP